MALQQVEAGPEDPVAALLKAGQKRQALAACVHHYGAALGRFCMALLGDQGEAEETVQEALIAAHDGFDGWRGEGSPKAWLYGIARRMCARRLAKRVRRAERLKLVHDAAKDGPLPDEVLHRRQQAQQVRRALDELKPSDREVLLMRFEAQLSYREIAEIAGIDEQSARKRTSRALARMRELFPQLHGGL